MKHCERESCSAWNSDWHVVVLHYLPYKTLAISSAQKLSSFGLTIFEFWTHYMEMIIAYKNFRTVYKWFYFFTLFNHSLKHITADLYLGFPFVFGMGFFSGKRELYNLHAIYVLYNMLADLRIGVCYIHVQIESCHFTFKKPHYFILQRCWGCLKVVRRQFLWRHPQ